MQRLARHRKHQPPLTLAPSELQRSMAQIGPVWAKDIEGHGRTVFDGYAPLLRAAPRDGIGVTRDAAYGPHPRQVVDIYHPVRRRPGEAVLPVVLFVHGGAYVRGERDVTPEIYSNVPTWFARNGCVGVNVEYRLAPEAVYPDGARDIGRAVAWVHENIHAYGGDPSRIVLVGHSSGGTHVAGYVFDAAARGEPVPRVMGQVLISARLRADVRPENPNAAGVRAYFGNDPALYDARSPISHAAGSRVPTMIVVAEFESPLLDVYGLDLFHCMSQSAPPELRFVRMDRHNHASIVAHFNTAEEILGEQILDFMASIAPRPAAGR
jgi:acetyl esterase